MLFDSYSMTLNLKLTPGEVDFLKSKKIGLVLSGGASRGFAEAGVMNVFEKHSIEPVAIVGASVGSLVGVCVAAGKSASILESEFLEHKPFTWRDVSLFKHSGLLNPEHVVTEILDILEVKSFSDLKIPLKVTATNLNTGDERVFSSGKLLSPLAASIAFPGVIVPRKIGRHLYADGGINNPIPVHLLPKNIDLVIVVDVTGKLTSLEDNSSTTALLKNVYEIMLHHISKRELEKIMVEHDAIVIQPPVEIYGLFNFSMENARGMIKTGEKTAKIALKKGIKRLKAKEHKEQTTVINSS